jgi:nucleoside-triphosphate--adenylate kinase
MVGKILRAVILGAPGSGKGTIAKRIITDFDMKYVVSGDILRSEVKQKTEIGRQAEEFMKKGALVPDTIMQKMIIGAMQAMKNEVWLLDGFPRTLAQAEALHQADTAPTVVVDLQVPFEVIIDRISKRWVHEPSGRVYNLDFNKPKVAGKDDVTGEPLTQRMDDRPDTVLARLKAYEAQTRPVSEFYKQKGILQEFHGRESNAIWPHVRKFLVTVRQPVREEKYT